MNTYMMLSCLDASASFSDDIGLYLQIKNKDGNVQYILSAFPRYVDQEGIRVPIGINIKVIGHSENMMTALQHSTELAEKLRTSISMISNCYVEHARPDIIIERRNDNEDQKFFKFMRERKLPLPIRRIIHAKLVLLVIGAIDNHRDHRRIERSMAHYCDALSEWAPGYEMNCLARLYMAVENLSKVVMRQKLNALSIDEERLAMEWGIEETDNLQRRKRLENEVKKRLIFSGDDKCFALARRASDGFEHGYMEFGELSQIARENLVKTARYFRRSLINCLNLPSEVSEILLGNGYNRPYGESRIYRYTSGYFKGNIDFDAIKNENDTPLKWTSKFTGFSKKLEGIFEMIWEDSFDSRSRDKVFYKLEQHKAWDGSIIKDVAPKNEST
jgi:hypothetical protein